MIADDPDLLECWCHDRPIPANPSIHVPVLRSLSSWLMPLLLVSADWLVHVSLQGHRFSSRSLIFSIVNQQVRWTGMPCYRPGSHVCYARRWRPIFTSTRGDEGADGDVNSVTVEQDLDQSSEGPMSNLVDEGKPRIIDPSFKIMQFPLICLCIYVSGVEWNPRCMIPMYLCSFTSMLGQ
jgi:hypothetical protein